MDRVSSALVEGTTMTKEHLPYCMTSNLIAATVNLGPTSTPYKSNAKTIHFALPDHLLRFQGIAHGISNANLAKKGGFQAQPMQLAVAPFKNVR